MTEPRSEPRWLRAVAFGSAAAVAAFGATGLAFAVVGAYRPLVVFPAGTVLWIGLLVVARPILRAPGGNRVADHAAGAFGLVLVTTIGVWNAFHASQHVLINRDGGVYTNAARWIAAHGTLRVVAATGPFAHQRGLTFASVGMFEDRRHVLSFQFAHLLPALLAEMRNLGGDRLMFAGPAVLSSVALLAFFVAAWRLCRNPLVALAAVACFAFVLPEVSFSRDAVSEIPSQVLLFTALWLIADRRALRSPRSTFVAGLFLGLLQAARIDALLLLVAVPMLFAVTWILAAPEDRRSVAASAGACAAGIAPGVVLGFTDLLLRSTEYVHGLRGNVDHLFAAAVLSVVLAFTAVAIAPRLGRVRPGLTQRTAWIVVPAVIAVGFVTWLVRPHVEHVRIAANPVVSLHQAAAGITVDATRAYWERSLDWMSWYFGPVTLTAAIVATALLARAVLRRRALDALAAFALLGPASVLYLWHANAFPDQVWVERRYLDSALPLIALLAFGLVAALLRWRPAPVPRVVLVGAAIAIAAVAVVYPITTVVPVRDMTEQRGDAAVIDDACRIVGPHAAIVVLPDPNGLDRALPQALRGWCNADVALMTNGPDRDALAQLSRDWSRSGRALWVVAAAPTIAGAAVPGARVVTTRVATNPHLLRSTLVTRPSRYSTEQFSLALARVPPG